MLSNAFLIAIKEIKRNILRSFLTILGIVIGVASVIAMVMIGDGTTANVQQSISKLGTNMLTLKVGQERRGPPREDNSAKPFTEGDINAIKNELQNIKAVAAENSSRMNIVYGNKSSSASVIGTNNDYFIIKDWETTEGRIFDENELNNGKSSCIVGTSVVKQLFADENPVGMNIRLKNLSCNIIGVLKSKGAAVQVRVLVCQNLGDRCGQRRLAVVNVTDGADIDVRLGTLKLGLRHFMSSWTRGS